MNNSAACVVQVLQRSGQTILATGHRAFTTYNPLYFLQHAIPPGKQTKSYDCQLTFLATDGHKV